MDFIFIIILMAVLYIVPELLKRRGKPKTYQYPDIPQPAPQPSDMKIKSKPAEPVQERFLADRIPTEQEVAPAAMPAASEVKKQEETPRLPGCLSQEALVNGVIFAEIINPPRAYRPLRRRL